MWYFCIRGGISENFPRFGGIFALYRKKWWWWWWYSSLGRGLRYKSIPSREVSQTADDLASRIFILITLLDTVEQSQLITLPYLHLLMPFSIHPSLGEYRPKNLKPFPFFLATSTKNPNSVEHFGSLLVLKSSNLINDQLSSSYI